MVQWLIVFLLGGIVSGVAIGAYASLFVIFVLIACTMLFHRHLRRSSPPPPTPIASFLLVSSTVASIVSVPVMIVTRWGKLITLVTLEDMSTIGNVLTTFF
ncbi:MAG: hypothetical protein Greene041614_848 [Parcubacteria group bacterium Greene0416_14]|nr:MAG: hypothetical protein Greene041614_848 [Parcubacteria group bacterium Greene0416_14]